MRKEVILVIFGGLILWSILKDLPQYLKEKKI
jgi:hypothetical protein